MGEMQRCSECSGSGACDPCDGYGCFPDSFPNAGDGPDCDVCAGDGICAECGGSGEMSNDGNDGSGDDGAVLSRVGA
ncbi:hypothetical protein [Pseudonocardia acidicola]|uniref:Molecular chaperone DnaJ n=1 Tax=Pseudonocardia acidicola TaxID=2724939 RepID=A0ABX1SIS4_9PSEU|nr:hypothetical protein [Pseudonocardia acidicola]NMI00860.1 hypothetical protein [Pseudonocardia acidicola]